MRRWVAGTAVDFSLYFEQMLEFWDFMRIVSRVISEYEIRRANYAEQSSEVVNTIASHEPSANLDMFCKVASHFKGESLFSPCCWWSI